MNMLRSSSLFGFSIMTIGGAAIFGLILLPAPIAAQVPAAAKASESAPRKAWVQPRTPDGQPDLQGVWTNVTLTPLERPAEFAGKPVLTAKEAEEYAKKSMKQLNHDNANVRIGYNEFWAEHGTTIADGARTSLIVDPPDGLVPPLTAEARKKEEARARYMLQHPADGPESLDLSARCIMRLDTSINHHADRSGVPMLPDGYNSNFQIVQTAGYVAIRHERIHDVRVIPLDGRPHVPSSVRSYLGDPRGHWEGNTLVVDSTNFTDKYNFRGSGFNLHLTERFTRVDANTINYEFTMDDPTTFTKPWTALIPMKATQDLIYEYACHEGNYSMTDSLAGARLEEKKAADAAAKKIN